MARRKAYDTEVGKIEAAILSGIEDAALAGVGVWERLGRQAQLRVNDVLYERTAQERRRKLATVPANPVVSEEQGYVRRAYPEPVYRYKQG